MQRKNNILKKHGFAMIMAIGVIMIIATIMALSLSMTRETGKRTTDLYLYEQAVLLSKSASEYALLIIAQNGPCHTNVANLNFTPDLNGNNVFNVNITLRYSYTNADATAGGCAAANRFATVTAPEQSGSVLMDVTVSVNDPSLATEPIRYFRRTIQKL
jgi:hypothetical protein